MTQIIIYFLLFGLMFVVLPFGHSPYEVPKAFAATIFIVILVFLSIITWVVHKGTPAIRRGSALLKITFFILTTSLAIYHLFYPTFPDNLLFGNSWRPHGTILYLSLFLLFLTSSKAYFNISLYSKIAFYSLIALFVFTLIIGPKGSFRFIGPLGEFTSLAAAVLFLFPFTTVHPNKKYRKISFVLSLILILLTGARAAILGFLFEILILLFRRHRKLFITGTTLLIVIFLFSFLTPFLPRNIPTEYFLRFEDRAEIWQVSLSALDKSPLIGSGFGAVQDILYKEGWETTSFTRFQSIDHAHNLFLQWGLMGGVAGVLILTSLILISFWNFYRSRSWVLLSILAGLFIIQSFNPVSVVALVHFWWLLGQSFDL